MELTCKGWVRQSHGPCFGCNTSGDRTSAIVGKCPEWNPCSLPLGSELTCKLWLPAMPDVLVELLVLAQLLFSLKLLPFPATWALARCARPRGRLNGLGGCWWRAGKKIRLIKTCFMDFMLQKFQTLSFLLKDFYRSIKLFKLFQKGEIIDEESWISMFISKTFDAPNFSF